MRRLKQSLKEIERRWLRPLFRWTKRHRQPMPPVPAGVESLLVAMLRAEIRRRAAGEKPTLTTALSEGSAIAPSDLESLARAMLTPPPEVRRAAG